MPRPRLPVSPVHMDELIYILGEGVEIRVNPVNDRIARVQLCEGIHKCNEKGIAMDENLLEEFAKRFNVPMASLGHDQNTPIAHRVLETPGAPVAKRVRALFDTMREI